MEADSKVQEPIDKPTTFDRIYRRNSNQAGLLLILVMF